MSATFGAMLPEARASRIDQDGALRKVPGNSTGAYAGDQQFFWLDFGTLGLTSAGNAERNNRMVPFDAKIVAAVIQYGTAPDADTSIDIGDGDDANTYDDHTAVAADLSNGDVEVVEGSDFATTDEVDQGDILAIATDGAATSGTAEVALILVPRTS